MEIVCLDGARPDSDFFTKITYMGNVTELSASRGVSRGGPCRKIDADHYLDLNTGELCCYRHGESRADNLGCIRRTLATIRALINCNITEPANCRWVTFTYAENMTDVHRLMTDWDAFRKRFYRWCSKSAIDKPEYIAVVEPQGRGAWHLHVFFVWAHTAPYLDNNAVIAPLWRHGFTKTKAVSDCDNIGAYFSAYLGDMPLDEYEKLDRSDRAPCALVDEKEVDVGGEKVKKKIVKGGRLRLYPPGMNIVRSSRGVKRPSVELARYSVAKEKVRGQTQTFQMGYAIFDGDNRVNTIFKEYYNSKRSAPQDSEQDFHVDITF